MGRIGWVRSFLLLLTAIEWMGGAGRIHGWVMDLTGAYTMRNFFTE